jgi:pimeloyl-[acyl-carrier protein] synthase
MSESTAQFLTRLADLDVRIWLDGDKLRVDAPKDVLTPDVVAGLREHKEGLVRFLSAPAAAAKAAFDPQDEAFVQHPYEVYGRLRETQPVYRSPQGPWVLTRYQDVREALLNPALANTPATYSWLHHRHRDASLGARVANNILPFMDGAPHVASRRLIASTFSAQLRRRFPDLRSIALEVLAPFEALGQLDVVNDFGRPYATIAIADLLGLPRADHAELAAWGDTFLMLLTGVPDEQAKVALEASLAEFRGYCAAVVARRRSAPTDDLLSALLAAGDDTARLTEDEVIDTAMLLVADGVENVASLIGSSLAILLEQPGELARMHADPEAARRVANECLRFETPGQYIARVASRDMEIGGQAVRANESVLLMLGAANRDGAEYPQPDEFQAEREASRHLSFGRGRHTCLGAQLVPQELEVALAVLHDRLPGLHALPFGAHWRSRPGHRWLQAFPVAFDIPKTPHP